MHPIPHSESADWVTFTPNATGFSAKTTDTGRYMLIGKLCVMVVRIVGTSNAATFNFTLPVACTGSDLTAYFGVCLGSDNGTTATRRYLFTTSTNCRLDASVDASDGWTASGGKNISLQVCYEIAAGLD